jgi:hypothetical protein
MFMATKKMMVYPSSDIYNALQAEKARSGVPMSVQLIRAWQVQHAKK